MKKVLLLLCAGLCLTVSDALAQQQEVLVPYRKGKKWGFCKLDKTIVIAPQFDDVQPFGEVDGTPLDDESTARVSKNGEAFWIDRKGKRKSEEAVNSTRVGEGPQMAELESGDENDRDPKVQLQDGKAGLLVEGKLILDYQYDSILADYYTVAEYAIAKSGGKWGVVFTEEAKRGKWLLPAQFDAVKDLMAGHHLFAVTTGGKQGLWNAAGEVLKPAFEQVALAGSNWHYCAIAAYGKSGLQLYSLKGKKLNNELYEWAYTEVGSSLAEDEANGFYRLMYVRKNSKYGMVDNTGKALTACRYDQIAQFYDKPFTLVEFRGVKGYIGVKGTEYFEE